MKVKRNTEGIKKAAQQKREESFQKVEKGIQQLVKDGATINFNTVARASGVSKAWLYKEELVKSRIEHLRQQSGNKKKTLPAHRASDSSKKVMIRTLKERIKRLDAENKELRKQNQVAYGQVLRVRELEQQVTTLRTENQRLNSQTVSTMVPSQQQSEPQPIEDLLKDTGVSLNSTLCRLIDQAPASIVETAVDSLKQAQKVGEVRNPGGFLNKAISDQWQPNTGGKVTLPQAEMDEFNEWWKWAYPQGLVKAATQIDGIQHVLTKDEQWVPFKKMPIKGADPQ